MELKEQLDALKSSLEAKNAEEVKNAIATFESKFNEAVANETKAVKEELTAQLEEVKKHANELDVKLQAKAKNDAKSGDILADLVKENVKEISEFKGKRTFETKAVGDMTLSASYAGDSPRDYNFDVVYLPGQMVNVADLCRIVPIQGGAYTYYREDAVEGSISDQTEGQLKSQIDTSFTEQIVNTGYLAGFAVYSKKMRNNLPFLERSVPLMLRREYFKAENAKGHAVIASQATASDEVITGSNKAEMLMNEIAKLRGKDFGDTNGIVVRPEDYNSILQIEKSTGAGYGLPFGFSLSPNGGGLMCLDVPVVQATWLPANKYIVGDWSRVSKVVTEGLSLEFAEQDGDNFRKNNITARIEADIAFEVEQPDAVIYGDFTAV